MALVVPNNGEAIALSYLVNKTSPENLVLCLYQNNVTPGETDTVGTYTEATFTGYASITLTGASWTVTPGAPSSAAYAQQTFTSSAGSQSQTIYGYFLKRVTTTTGDIVYAERFSDAPVTITNLNDQIKVTPTITAD
jgi:hypothetical protein